MAILNFIQRFYAPAGQSKRSLWLLVSPVALTVFGMWILFERITDWELPVGIGMAIILAAIALWKVPAWQVAQVDGLDSKGRFDRVNEARKTLAQIVGGTLLLIGFYATWKGIGLSREGQITDRFAKAIEQLGAAKAGVRVGGIYALERIAKDSERDHWTVMEVLTAYIRDNAQRKKDTGDTGLEELKPAADIEAALTVLIRRDRQYERQEQIIDLRHTDLRHVDLDGAHLEGVNLQDADIRWANLSGAHLGGVKLGQTDMTRADFSRADLTDADLTAAILNATDLTEAILTRAHLRRANLVSSHLDGAHLDRADLSDASLSSAYLKGASFAEADLSRAILNGLDLSQVKGLSQQQIEKATGNTATVLPKGLHTPESWKSNPQ